MAYSYLFSVTNLSPQNGGTLTSSRSMFQTRARENFARLQGESIKKILTIFETA